MLGINPFDHRYGYERGFGGGYERRPPPGRRPPEPSAAEPHFATNTTADAYTITVSAPAGHTLDGPRASLISSREMEIVGVLHPSSTSCEFLTLGRTPVYAKPLGRQLLGVVPPRTVVGGEPYKHGWIALDNDDGWVQIDGLRMISRPASPRRFSEILDVPSDALPRHATSSVLESGSLQVTVPRRQRAARHETAWAAPTRRAAPQSPRSWPTRPTAASTPPVKPAAPTPAAPKPAARTAKRTASPKPSSAGQGLPASADGPVLDGPVLASNCNVQLPHETTQHWHASACGGFVTSEAMAMRDDVVAAAVSPDGSTDDNELEFYGF